MIKNFLRTLGLLFSVLFLTACHKVISVPGSVNGNFIYLDSPVAGKLVAVACQNSCAVKKGQTLFVISLEKAQQRYDALMEIKKRLQAHLAALQQYKVHSNLLYERERVRFELEGIETLLQSKEKGLKKFTIKSPSDAWVYNVYYRVGDYVLPNVPMMSVLPQHELFVVFYVQHTKHLHVGDRVTVHTNLKSFPARIVYNAVAGELSGLASSVRYQYHAVPLDAGRGLMPGMRVSVSFST